jgi:hypothetical protein
MDKRTQAYVDKIDELLAKVGPLNSSWRSSNMGGGFKDMVTFESLYTEAISLLSAVYGSKAPHYQ